MIWAAGFETLVVEYLKTGWARDLIGALLRDMGMTARELMREKGAPVAELGLQDEGTTNAAIIEAMLTHPILVNRPIVATSLGVKLNRPSEVVLTLLDQKPETFTKEDGEVVKL
jgi:arsenate reductase